MRRVNGVLIQDGRYGNHERLESKGQLMNDVALASGAWPVCLSQNTCNYFIAMSMLIHPLISDVTDYLSRSKIRTMRGHKLTK